ncbi:DNA-binding transcriptional regulator, AcrR family [Paramicrobacterium humi]|uniref:DNA-binding transcriptional regulator, AcrR family n=1 Tax=Paramicrobacterium humi TaxID=640635 RepID=A0A1H4LQK8_9MICO|nr:TetR/AcrR family transcriptional regulator [Microbacterium humi]SEB72876.1 DNA-binding transcriptional regulator, AcrR family [Microbacterium humi]
MGSRNAAAQRTRTVILDAAERLLAERWYDEVTLADIAREAGVSQQTIVNHFGSKGQLYLVGLEERTGPRITKHRAAVRVGDLASVVDVAVSDYEQSGPGTLRMLALADRIDALAEAAEYGRRAHRAWVESALAPQIAALDPARRARATRLLVAALDVFTWAQLRQAQGLDAAATRADLEALVEGILAHAA